MSQENLSRRAILAGAASVPALALPAAVASTLPATSISACTLPPDLVERFVRVRASYLDSRKRENLWRDEVDRRFLAATGVQWDDVDCDHPRWKKLQRAHSKICSEVPEYESDAETDARGDERWSVAEALIFDHNPQTFADLAWQAEAYLVADLDLLSFAPDSSTSDRLIRTLFRYIRTLGALPDDPLGALSLDIGSDSEEVQS
jgi:hypothetical protein